MPLWMATWMNLQIIYAIKIRIDFCKLLMDEVKIFDYILSIP